MKSRYPVLLAVLVVSLSILVSAIDAGSGAAASRAKGREFEGQIAKVNRAKKTFSIARPTGGITFKVNGSTRYDDISGFGALKRGLRVEVKAHRVGKSWVATKVEREDGDDDGDDD
jgi:hypothetical protein